MLSIVVMLERERVVQEPYSLYPCPLQVGQRHGGFTGMIQYACSLAQRHIWFERKIAEDRKMVAKR